MRRTNRNSGFWLCVLLNLLLNLEWTVPAWIFLGLHFWIGWSIWWFVGSIALWVGLITARTAVFAWAGSCATASDKPKVNKNPYSVGSKDSSDEK